MIELLTSLNSNKLFVGLAVILMNLGSRYVITDLTKLHERILKHDLIKKLILFCMFFAGTRDVVTAFLLTIGSSIIIKALFDENSKYHLLPSSLLKDLHQQVTPHDYENAKKTIELFEKQIQGNKTINSDNDTNKTLDPIYNLYSYDDYMKRMQFISSY